MATLPTATRVTIWREFMDFVSRERQATSVSKTDLQLAVNALDDFLNSNATAINNAIPLPARTQLSATHKALLLMYVIGKRYLAA